MVVTRSQDNKKEGKKSEGKEKNLKKEGEKNERGKEKEKKSPKRKETKKGNKSPPSKKKKSEDSDEKKENQKSSSEETTVEESGIILFAHKSKTNEDGKKIDTFYVQLEPKEPSGRKMKALNVVRKRLPSISKHERLFAFVAAVGDEVNQVTKESEGLAKGTYEFVGYHNSSHLAYTLSTENEGEIQKKLKKYNIHPNASFVIAVKNPDESTGNFEFPKELQQRFEERKWINQDISLFLEHKGANLIFIGASDDIIKELGEEGEHIAEEAETLKD